MLLINTKSVLKDLVVLEAFNNVTISMILCEMLIENIINVVYTKYSYIKGTFFFGQPEGRNNPKIYM